MTKHTWSKRAQREHRKKWVAALESGEYGQTKNMLTNGQGFCCLGVACEISGLGEWVDGPYGEWVYEVDGEGSNELLPEPVREWLGLAGEGGDFNSDTESLANLNDKGKTFKSIAKVIREEPVGLIAG